MDYLNKLKQFLHGGEQAVQNEVQALPQQINNVANYFNPTSNNGNNFWSSPIARAGASLQTNVAQPLITGYTGTFAKYSPVFHDQIQQAYNAEKGLGWDGGQNPNFAQTLSQGIGGTIPMLPAAEAIGGTLGRFIPPVTNPMLKGFVGMGQAGLTGAALGGIQPANSLQQRGQNSVQGFKDFAPYGVGSFFGNNRVVQGLAGAGISGAQSLAMGDKPQDAVVNTLLGGVLSASSVSGNPKAEDAINSYLRDEKGQFSGMAPKAVSQIKKQALDKIRQQVGKGPNEPVYYSDLKKAVEDNFPQPGLSIKIVGKQPLSSEGVIKRGKMIVKNIPTQTEIKNRAEVNAGNPDLYTQRQTLLKEKGLVGQPTAKEQASMDAMDRLVGDQNVQGKLAGGKYKIDNGMGTPVNPKPKVNMPFGETKNKVDFSIKGNTDKEKVLSAIANSERTQNSITLRGKEAYIAGQKLSKKDRALVDQYQEGQPISELAKKAENPQAFTEFMNKMTDYYDYRLATDRALGGATNRRENYIHQYWDLSNPQDLQRFNQLAKQKGLQAYKGFSAQPRVFNTYAEGEAAGFKRLYSSAVEDLQQDYAGASHALSKRALQRGLELGVPEKISEAGKGFTENGKPFINSNIPGMEGVSLHPDVHNMLKGFEPVKSQDLFTAIKEHGLEEGIKSTGAWDSFWSLYDHASQPMKQFLLNFSGFHSINISANFSGEGLFSPLKGARGLAQSVPSFFSEGATQKIIQSFKNKQIPGRGYSVYEAGLRSGQKMDRGLPVTGLKRLNVFGSLQRAIFDRELYTLRLNLNDMVFGDGKVDPESPQGINAGKEIDKVLGEINTKTMNINPNSMKWASRVFLAPQFTVSKYSTLKDTVTANSTQRALALKAVFGKSLVLGSLSTLGTLLATGQLPTLQQILTNFTTDPEIQTNLTNPKGKKQDIALPNSFISEPLRPVLGEDGLLNGSTVGLQHYGQARLNPMLTNGAKLLPDAVDYYGNPIVDPESTKSVPEQLMQNVGVGMLPIGAQNVVSAAQGKITPTQAGINIIGLRTHTSPNDPTMQYFKAKDEAYSKLDKTQQAAFDSIPKQDPADPLARQYKYVTMMQYPAVYNAKKEIALKEGGPVDPIYTVPYETARTYMLYEAQNPGSQDKKSLYKAHPEIGELAKARSDFFTANPIAGGSDSGAPRPSARVQQLMNAKNFKDPEVKAYLDANTAYNNQLRETLGLTSNAGFTPYAKKPKKFAAVKGKIKAIKVKSIAIKSPKGSLKKPNMPKLTAFKSPGKASKPLKFKA
jgi:hypothetical protein